MTLDQIAAELGSDESPQLGKLLEEGRREAQFDVFDEVCRVRDLTPRQLAQADPARVIAMIRDHRPHLKLLNAEQVRSGLEQYASRN